MPTSPKKRELTEVQRAIFEALVEDDRAAMKEIADKLGVSTQTVHIAIQVLEARGLITREPGKARSVRIVEARA